MLFNKVVFNKHNDIIAKIFFITLQNFHWQFSVFFSYVRNFTVFEINSIHVQAKRLPLLSDH